jgi:anaerobic selenocysteine-containing dehydrogenase
MAETVAEERRRVRTHCRCCSACCGIVVEAEGEQVLSVRGDPENTRSRGYICPKGASLAWFHQHPESLLRPRVLGREIGWGACVDDLGERLRGLIAAHGPDSVALYQGTGTVGDTFGIRMGGQLIGAIGSSQFYTAATVDVAPALRAAELVAGSAELLPVWVPEDEYSRLVIMIGLNPAVSHGYITIMPDPVRRIAEFRQRGGTVWVVDPKATRTAGAADHYLAIRPGADAALLAWLIRELMEEGGDAEDFARMTSAAEREALRDALAPFDREPVGRVTGLDPAYMDRLLADIRRAGRIAVVAGTGITLGGNGLVAEWLRWALLIVTGSLDRPGGMWFNPGWLEAMEQRLVWPEAPAEGWIGPGPRSRPELKRMLGQNPCVAVADEIEAGNIRALIVSGSSPLTAFPDPERLERAFRSLDVLATIDVIETKLTRMSTHVLPATGQLERSDIMVETRTMFSPAVVPPLGERRPMWRIFGEIGRTLGVDLLGGRDPEQTGDEDMLRGLAAGGRDGADALFAAGPDGLMPPRLHGWVREKVLSGGRWRLMPPGLPERLPGLLVDVSAARLPGDDLILVSGRQLSRTNATQYVPPRKSRDMPDLHMHPTDAEARQLAPGDRVWLTTDNGRIGTTIRLDETLRPGVVSVAHGWHEANLGLLTTGETVDPLTGQPAMTAIAVGVESGA